jgi:hypothetical protein
MFKSCRYCKYCYSEDLDSVGYPSCKKHPLFKLIHPDYVHPWCGGFKFSILKFLFGI